MNRNREEKNVHNHHRKKIFWRRFLAPKRSFPGRWWIQKPYKNLESRNLSFVDPIFSAKRSSALEQGGVCFLLPRELLCKGRPVEISENCQQFLVCAIERVPL